MGFWISTAAAFAIALTWFTLHRRSLRQWRRLEQVLGALGEGREPGSYIFVDGGRFEDLSAKLHNVAQEQERLRKLAEDERFNLRTILASMEEGVMVVDSQHVVQRVNPSFLRLFSLVEAPLGQTVLSAVREVHFEEVVTAALRDAQPQEREVQLTGVKPAKYVAVQAVPLRDSSGQLAVLAIFRDVTRLKQLEEVRREFVANVSHELRTPLSVFHGYVEMLLDHPHMPPEEVQKIFMILKRHSLRLNALVEDLLVLARLESRRGKMHFQRVYLQDSVEAIAQDWEAKMAEKSVSIEQVVTEDLPAVWADPLRLDQIFNNLLDNALKYTPNGGRIAIRAARDGETAILRVEDNGAGIPPEDVPHIFERFYRADKARSREMGGTGLGLSIVKHIAQAHGGSVHAESTFGKGTAIILKLPLARKEAVEEEEELAAHGAA